MLGWEKKTVVISQKQEKSVNVLHSCSSSMTSKCTPMINVRLSTVNVVKNKSYSMETEQHTLMH